MKLLLTGRHVMAGIDSAKAEFAAAGRASIDVRGVGLFIADGNCEVTSHGGMLIKAYGHSIIYAHDLSHVSAEGETLVNVYGDAVVHAYGKGVLVCKRSLTAKVWLHDGAAMIDMTRKA